MGQVLDLFQIARGHQLGINERAADAEGTSAGFEKLSGRFQIHATRRHQANVRQGTMQGLQIFRTGDLGRKNLDDVGSGLPGLKCSRCCTVPLKP